MAGGKKIWKTLLKILGGVLTLLLLVLCAASLILAKPQEKTDTPADQPPLSASPAIEIQQESDLFQLISAFPAPVMSFMSGSGKTFVSAVSADTAVSGGFGRIATLYWQTADGIPMILQSIYPAGALNLLETGYHFSVESGPMLFGSPSVRMEKNDTVRLHTTTDQGLYVITLPRSADAQIPSLSRSLQLFTVQSDD